MPIDPRTGQYVDPFPEFEGKPPSEFDSPQEYAEQITAPNNPKELKEKDVSDRMGRRPRLDETIEDADFQAASSILYHDENFNRDRDDYNPDATPQEIAKWAFDRHSDFEFNVKDMALQWKNIGSMSDESIQAWNTVMDHWEDTDLDFGETLWHAGRGILTDPTTYLGLGLGKVAAKGSTWAAKKLIKDEARRITAKRIMTPALIGAAEGGVIAGATATGREHVGSTAENRSFDLGGVMAETAMGTVAGATIGGALGAGGVAAGKRIQARGDKMREKVGITDEAAPAEGQQAVEGEAPTGATDDVNKAIDQVDDPSVDNLGARENIKDSTEAAERSVLDSMSEDVPELRELRAAQLEEAMASNRRMFKGGKGIDEEQIVKGGIMRVMAENPTPKTVSRLTKKIVDALPDGDKKAGYIETFENAKKGIKDLGLEERLKQISGDQKQWSHEDKAVIRITQDMLLDEFESVATKIEEAARNGGNTAKLELEMTDILENFLNADRMMSESSYEHAYGTGLHRILKEQMPDVASKSKKINRALEDRKVLGGQTRALRLIELIRRSPDIDSKLNTIENNRFRQIENFLVGLSMNGMLSRPDTQVLNVTGMALNSLVDRYMVRLPLVLFNHTLQKAGINLGKDAGSHTMKAWRMEGLATSLGLQEGMKFFWGVFKAQGYKGIGKNMQAKIEAGEHTAIGGWKADEVTQGANNFDWKKTKLRRAVNLPTTLLRATDELAKSIFYHRAYAREAMERAQDIVNTANRVGDEPLGPEVVDEAFRDIWNRQDPDMVDKAMLAAQQMTFTDESKSPILRMAKTLQGIPFAGRLLLPFVHTIHNLAAVATRISPFAPASSRWRKMWKAGGRDRQYAIAQWTMGSAFMVTMGFALHGREQKPDGSYSWKPILTGAGPTNIKMKKMFEQSGWKPNSILIDGEYWSYADLEPFATVLSTAATAMEFVNGTYGDMAGMDKHGRDLEHESVFFEVANGFGEALLGSAYGGLQGVVDNSYTRDMLDTFEMLTQVTRGEMDGKMIPRKLAQITARVTTPFSSVTRGLVRGGQEYKRDTKVEAAGEGIVKWWNQYTQELKGQAGSHLPGSTFFMEDAPLKRKWDGTPIKMEDDLLPGLVRIRGSAAGDDPLTNELVIHQRAGIADFDPNITYTDAFGNQHRINTRTISNKAFEDLAVRTGKLRRKYVGEVISRFGYTDLSDNWGEADGGKAVALQEALNLAQREADRWFTTESKWATKLEEAAQQGQGTMTKRSPQATSHRTPQQQSNIGLRF